MARISPTKESNSNDDAGPVMMAKRRCRDVFFLVIFCLYIILMALVGYNAIHNGQPQYLIVPQDKLGNYCGYDNTLTRASATNLYPNQLANPYLYYFDPTKLTAGTYICVSQCPSALTLYPLYNSTFCNYGTANFTDEVTYLAAINNNTCSLYTYPTTSVLNICTPLASALTGATTAANLTATSIGANSSSATTSSTASSSSSSAASFVSAGTSTAVSVISSIITTWPVIVVGIAASVGISFVWLILIQYFASVFVWIILVFANVVLIALALFFYFYWQMTIGNATGVSVMAKLSISASTLNITTAVQGYLQYAFYVFAGVAGIMFLITIAMIKRIKLAVGVIKQASVAMMKMPAIILFPFNIFIMIAGIFAYFIVVLLYIISANLASSSVLTLTLTTTQYIELGIHTLGFLWILNYISGLNQVTIAGAIGTWYWASDKKARLVFPVLRSCYRAMRYNAGSIAAGSLLIAIVSLLKMTLYQFTSAVDKIKMPLLKFLLICVRCALGWVSVLIKFVNQNSYVFISISGQSFFHSASHATGLLLKHSAKTAAVDFVSGFILLLSKLIVTIIAAVGCYLYILGNTATTYASVAYPQVSVALVALGAYMISSAFFSVYDMSIDALFLCFLEDLETNDGSSAKPYYMPEALATLMNVQVPSQMNSSPKKVYPTPQPSSPASVGSSTPIISPISATSPTPTSGTSTTPKPKKKKAAKTGKEF